MMTTITKDDNTKYSDDEDQEGLDEEHDFDNDGNQIHDSDVFDVACASRHGRRRAGKA